VLFSWAVFIFLLHGKESFQDFAVNNFHALVGVGGKIPLSEGMDFHASDS
jgi:hypothetical protein